MKLKELEKILRGAIVVSIQWKDDNYKIKEIITHIHLIKYCSDKLLNSEVLRFEIENNTAEIFLKL